MNEDDPLELLKVSLLILTLLNSQTPSLDLLDLLYI